MNIILFGPPGIGKSTIIGILKRNNVAAIDLEDVYPSNIRFQLPSMVDGVVFGAADLNPRRNYTNAIKVLLTYDTQREYDEQRAMRDKRNSGKKAQHKQAIEDWLSNTKYDYIISLTPYRNQPERVISSPAFVNALDQMVTNTGKGLSPETLALAKISERYLHRASESEPLIK